MNPALLIGAAQGLIGGIGLLTNKRPQYEIPAAQQQSLALAQANASGNMGGYNQAINNVGANTANAFTAAREAGNPLSVIGQIQGNQNQAVNNIDAQNAQFKQQQQQNLQQKLSEQAQYQDQQFQINKFQPFVDKSNMFQNMLGAGLKNSMGAFDQQNSLNVLKDGFGQMQQNQSVSNYLNGGNKNGSFNSNIMDMPTRSYNGVNTGFSSPIMIG